MRIKTVKGYWVMNRFVRVIFFTLKRDATKYVEENEPIDGNYTIKKGTKSHKI